MEAVFHRSHAAADKAGICTAHHYLMVSGSLQGAIKGTTLTSPHSLLNIFLADMIAWATPNKSVISDLWLVTK